MPCLFDCVVDTQAAIAYGPAPQAGGWIPRKLALRKGSEVSARPLGAGWHLAEQWPKPFSHGRVREDRIAQHRIWQFSHHRSLYDRKDLARLWAYSREAEDFVSVLADERFHEAARFRKCPGAKHGLHRQLRYAVRAAGSLSFVFTESNSCYFRVSEQTERH